MPSLARPRATQCSWPDILAGMAAVVLQESRLIAAPAQVIFDVLADPSQHAVIDGSGSVRKARGAAPTRLALGSRFGMDMRIGVPYRITNTVVEFDEPYCIAWRHFGGHIWRYELEPNDEGTLVTETFDARTGREAFLYKLLRVEQRHPKAMARTLARLDRLATTGSVDE